MSEEASALRIQKWCKENQENYHTFKYWKGSLKKSDPMPPFEEQELILRIELWHEKTKITFPKGCKEQTLKSRMHILKELSCLL